MRYNSTGNVYAVLRKTLINCSTRFRVNNFVMRVNGIAFSKIEFQITELSQISFFLLQWPFLAQPTEKAVEKKKHHALLKP